MAAETADRLMDLCRLAASEQDPKKLILLIEEINRLLEEKQERLNAKNDSHAA